eukprot:742414-Alexandrium_andersonii.AAC.1
MGPAGQPRPGCRYRGHGPAWHSRAHVQGAADPILPRVPSHADRTATVRRQQGVQVGPQDGCYQVLGVRVHSRQLLQPVFMVRAVLLRH